MGVEIHNPATGRTIVVADDRVAAVHARSGWERTDALAQQADETMPEHADDLIAWIGDDPERAHQALEAESTRPKPRTTVTEHIESVLDTESQED